LETGHVDIQDPHIYAAKKKYDPNSPSLHQALHSEHADQYMVATKKEIQSFIQQPNLTKVPRAEAEKVIKATLVFKL
jgi:hypothetical protein